MTPKFAHAWIAALLALATLSPVFVLAAGAEVRLDRAPGSLDDRASLQRGAKFFVANCLACHSAAYMRYNRLADIGMSEDEIKALLPAGIKAGSTMQAAMAPDVARLAFGVPPPDLSVEVRVRGTDWLYTYMRGFYVDTNRPTGVNNLVLPNVAMPNVLGGLQGDQALHVGTGAAGHEVKTLKLVKPGSMSTAQFDATVADLVNYLDFMSEPAKLVRHRLGFIVIGFLLVLLVLAYLLKKEIWKDVH